MSQVFNKIQVLISSNRAHGAGFISDRMNFATLGIALLINIIHWVVLYIKIKPSQQNVVLHYNVSYGTDLVDKAIFIYFIPGLALLFLIVNLIIALIFFRREKLSAYFLNFGTIAVQLIFLAASLSLIYINE